MYSGIKSIKKSKCVHNRYNEGKTQLTVGQSSSGVRESTIAEFIREMSQNRDDLCIHIIDPLNHYQSTINKLGGEQLIINNKNPMNPFRIPDNISFIRPDIYNTQLIFSKSFIKNLLGRCQLSQNTLDKLSEGILRKMYSQNNIIVGSSNPNSNLDIYDLEDLIDKAINDPTMVNLPRSAKSKILRYNNIFNNAETEMFSGHSLYKEPSSKSNNIRQYKTGLSNKTGFIQREIIKKIFINAINSDKKHLVISDESHLMFGSNNSEDLQKIIENDINNNFSLNVVLNSVKSIVEEQKLVRAFDEYRIHRYSFSNKERKLLGISNYESKMLSDAKRIGGGSNKSRCIIRDGRNNRNVKIDLTKKEMNLVK
jgi:hypothetical protein